MAWIQLRINTHAEEAEALGEQLSELGAQAVTFVDAKDMPWFEPKPGEVQLWPDTQVVGLFDASEEMPPIVRRIKASVPEDTLIKLDPLEDKDWEREWMDNFHPVRFGKRLWICPSWRDVPEPDAVNVMLDPGLAFGTGTHPTTALCLRWLDGLDLTNCTVVDFGCGSGILGIAALKLGARRVIGIDIDPQAIQASEENARRNDVAEQIELYLPKQQPELQADIVVANILAGPLRDLRQVITDYCHPGTLLALSGILKEQAEDLHQLYSQDFDMDAIAIDGDWARVSGIRKA